MIGATFVRGWCSPNSYSLIARGWFDTDIVLPPEDLPGTRSRVGRRDRRDFDRKQLMMRQLVTEDDELLIMIVAILEL